MILRGGRNLYGVPVGVICLDSKYPKVPGHIRNASTFNFPVVYKVVEGVTIKRVIDEQDPSLLDPFIEAVRELEREGVLAITGSCGFLALFQEDLANAVNVPVFISSLIQVPMVHRMLKRNQKVGILTAKKQSLTVRHLRAVGADGIPIAIAGMDHQEEFNEVIIEGKRVDLDIRKLEDELLHVTNIFKKENPDIGAIVLECTDMTSFAPQIQKMVRLPIFDIVTLTEMVYAVVGRKTYHGLSPDQA